MLKTAVGRLRLIGIIEGLSYLALLGFAMPMKYIWEEPEYVKFFGQAHGLLFVLYAVVLMYTWGNKKLNIKWAAIAFVASILPFGPFIIDGKLKDLDPDRS